MSTEVLGKRRRLPPRAAARADRAAKRRDSTPAKPSSPPSLKEPACDPTPSPPSLPTSIRFEQPLPTVETSQLKDLAAEEYQSILESGVLAESLSRSRHKWLSEGLFEKYWTKPYKRKGVLHEDPKNPPKESMIRTGNVTLIIGPHVVETTMFIVKTPKKTSQQQSQVGNQQGNGTVAKQAECSPAKTQVSARPVLQYGPPKTSIVPAAAVLSTEISPLKENPPPAAPQGSNARTSNKDAPTAAVPPSTSAAPIAPTPVTTPEKNTLGSDQVSQRQLGLKSSGVPKAPSKQSVGQVYQTAPAIKESSSQSAASATPKQNTTAMISSAKSSDRNAESKPCAGAKQPVQANTAPKPATNDPVIALLAQKASADPELRDLMKRVSVGQAKSGELAQFQKVIDQLNAEYRQKGGQQGPSADRLLVDGRTVRYFADEVRTILNIVLTSNPHQKSTELRPPPRSDALVVLLVKTALEDQRTKNIIHRIADGRPGFTDAQDLKDILDRLHRDAQTVPKGPPPPLLQSKKAFSDLQAKGKAKPTSFPNNRPAVLPISRSKGPGISTQPEISAVVLDFGNGDRYLFPKFSILEFLPMQSGQQVVASFLIVRRGSYSEYGADPALDYYQPVTIRLQTNGGRQLENLARVVAPQDEVQRYMNHVMDNMTRAEYVLLAMRLPRNEVRTSAGALAANAEVRCDEAQPPASFQCGQSQDRKPGVLWSIGSAKRYAPPADPEPPYDNAQEDESRYEQFICTVTEKEVEAVY